ncbi:MAG: putative sulfate exporter family transporter [Gammaproteobacteria bacterium]|nr:putative sulfate exporter family transporter [Gammaproteobacteria bacterium]
MQAVLHRLPGLALCAFITAVALLLSPWLALPALLLALLLGLVLFGLADHPRFSTGIDFSANTLLKIGVALLGARISFEQVMVLGMLPLLLAIAGIILTLAFGLLAARGFGLSRVAGVLSGGAVAICGASAAMALAAVLPQRDDSQKQLLFTIIAVTAISTLAMLLYPWLASLMPLDQQAIGLFLGGTIHNVPQAVGAGYLVSDPAGDAATLIKLMRVAMLAPVVMLVSLLVSQRTSSLGGKAPLPLFLVGFVVLVTINSLGWLGPLQPLLVELSSLLLVVAIAAIGMKASIGEMLGLGWRPLLLVVAETIFLVVVVATGLLCFY